MNKVHIVDVGTGSPRYLTMEMEEVIRKADIVVGFKPPLDTIREFVHGEIVEIDYAKEGELLKYVADKSINKKCVFCCTGDPDFSDSQLLEKIAFYTEIEILPGVSSVQVAASEARVAFDNSVFISFHKRGPIEAQKRELLSRIKENKDVILLPRPYDFMPEEIAKYLMENGISPDTRVIIYENLTMDEREHHKSLKEIEGNFSDLHNGYKAMRNI
ncbi:precorrin-6y C5,15-methyltransferase (decarboxylating) subunit CbiE [Chloroflexota bacterium]